MMAFPAEPYTTESSPNWAWNIASAANVMDLHADVSESYTHFHGKIRKAFKRNSGGYVEDSERSNLMGHAEPSDSDSFCEEDDIGPRLYGFITSLSGNPICSNETYTIEI